MNNRKNSHKIQSYPKWRVIFILLKSRTSYKITNGRFSKTTKHWQQQKERIKASGIKIELWNISVNYLHWKYKNRASRVGVNLSNLNILGIHSQFGAMYDTHILYTYESYMIIQSQNRCFRLFGIRFSKSLRIYTSKYAH